MTCNRRRYTLQLNTKACAYTMRLRSGKVTVAVPPRKLFTLYKRYLTKGKFEKGRPLSLKAYAQRFCPGLQLAKTGIRVPLDVLRVQYRCKLNWSMHQNSAMHTSLLQPITPFTVSTIIHPYACDPCLLSEAAQVLNEVRVRYISSPNGALQ